MLSHDGHRWNTGGRRVRPQSQCPSNYSVGPAAHSNLPVRLFQGRKLPEITGNYRKLPGYGVFSFPRRSRHVLLRRPFSRHRPPQGPAGNFKSVGVQRRPGSALVPAQSSLPGPKLPETTGNYRVMGFFPSHWARRPFSRDAPSWEMCHHWMENKKKQEPPVQAMSLAFNALPSMAGHHRQGLSVIPSPWRERVRVRVKSWQVARLTAARYPSQNYLNQTVHDNRKTVHHRILALATVTRPR